MVTYFVLAFRMSCLADGSWTFPRPTYRPTPHLLHLPSLLGETPPEGLGPRTLVQVEEGVGAEAVADQLLELGDALGVAGVLAA